MDLNTEIRKLSSKDLFNLVQILEIDESWRKLMATIPRNLFLNDNYECKITIHNRHKYNSDHFKIIENAGSKYKKLCSEILLDEWGTSGRIRPRLGHLISLLKKAELYRAADYVAVNLLQLSEVERPSTGPAAKVPIPRDEDLQNLIHSNYPSSFLNGDPLPSSVLNRLRTPSPNYPSSLVDGQLSSSVLNQIAPNQHLIPKIIIDNNYGESIIENSEISVVSEVSTENNSNVPAFSDLLKSNSKVRFEESKTNNIESENSSTELDFSNVSAVNQEIVNNPAFSQILNQYSASDLPNLSLLNQPDLNSSQNLPNLSILNQPSSENSQPDQNSSQNLPNLSILNQNSTENMPAFSQIISDSTSEGSNAILPNLTLLNQSVDSSNPNFPMALSHNLPPGNSQANISVALSQNLPNLTIFDKSNSNTNESPAFSQILDLQNSVTENRNFELETIGQQGPAFSQILDFSQNEKIGSQNLESNSGLEGPAFSQILGQNDKISEITQNESNLGSEGPTSNLILNLNEKSGSQNLESNLGLQGPAFSQILSQNEKIVSSHNLKSNLDPRGPAFSQILSHNEKISSSQNESDSALQGPAFSQIFSETKPLPKNQNLESKMSNPDNQGAQTPGLAPNQILDGQNRVNIPNLSNLNLGESLAFSQISKPKTNLGNGAQTLETGLPKIMTTLGSQNNIKIPELRVSDENLGTTDGIIPAFSQILDPLTLKIENPSSTPSSGSVSPNFPTIKSNSSSELRDLDTASPNLKGSKNSLKFSENFGSNLTVQSSSSRTCVSPLPNLSLNTILPHFMYLELEKCTNNFDETVVSDQDANNLNQAARIGRKLGSGAFGTVYLGIGLLDKPIAVKKLNLNGVNVVNVDDTITKQFRNEVELLCKYKHENLLSLLGYSCDGSTYCLIYEYICGGALKDRLEYSLKWPDRFRLLWTDRLYIALGTAKAVSYLHNAYSMPLIHRDIKSANILLDGFNKPKLCDFGLIKLTPNPNTNTSTSVFGTSAYMAPEAFRGDVSVKLDTFSFGVVLLELLTSLPPLDTNREGNDLVTHVEDLCENDIKPLLDTNAGSWVVDNTNFADELFEIAMECLEEKRHRPVMAAVVTKLSELIKKSVP